MKLSKTMAACLYETEHHGGKLIRLPGGYWTWPDCPRSRGAVPDESFGASTVQALVDRGEMEYTAWRDGRGGRFPVEASIKAKQEAA